VKLPKLNEPPSEGRERGSRGRKKRDEKRLAIHLKK